jgi:hypothetical protein
VALDVDLGDPCCREEEDGEPADPSRKLRRVRQQKITSSFSDDAPGR